MLRDPQQVAVRDRRQDETAKPNLQQLQPRKPLRLRLLPKTQALSMQESMQQIHSAGYVPFDSLVPEIQALQTGRKKPHLLSSKREKLGGDCNIGLVALYHQGF